MEFKNFTLNCYKLPRTDELMGVFKIRWTNGRDTKFVWSVFDDNNMSHQGVLFNNCLSSHLTFSTNLSFEHKYFVIVNEHDAATDQLISSSWEFINGYDIKNSMNSECVLSKITSKSLVPLEEPVYTFGDNYVSHKGFTFGLTSGTGITDDWNFGDWNTPFNFNQNICTDTYGMITPSQPEPVFNFTPLPSITDEQTNPIKTNHINVSGTLTVSGVLPEKSCEQELDELIKELDMMSIGESYSLVEEVCEDNELEDWEVELNRIIKELNEPFIKDKVFSDDTSDCIKPDVCMAVVENYLGSKYIEEPLSIFEPIPIPPPLPSPIKRYNSPVHSQSFKDELALVRNKVMGRKSEKITKSRKKWFSFFR